jgi:HAAS domain-containing protein
MAGTHLSPSEQPTSRDAVADYLSTVGAQLPGPPATRTRIIDELRDGLVEALEVHVAQGSSPQEATAAAIAEFGDPRMVAKAFAPELAAVQARRVAIGLLITGPLVGSAWIAAVAFNALPPWRYELTGPWLALPLAGLALTVACPALGLTVVATGRLGRRLDGGFARRPALPPTAAAVAGLAAVLADLTLLAIAGGQALAAPRLQIWAPVIVAASASLIRITLAGRAARRCLATRAALT